MLCVVMSVARSLFMPVFAAHLNLCIQGNLLLVVLFIGVGEYAQVVEDKFLLYSGLECGALIHGQAVALGDDGNDVYELGQLLQDDNINGLEAVTAWLNEEQAAVDSSILQVALTLSGEFFTEVGRVLVLDVLDDGVPASLVVDQITVTGGIDNVQSESHTILLDDV